MHLRSFLCSLVLLAVVAGDSQLLNLGQAHGAALIIDRPLAGSFNGRRRNIEINIRLPALYYGFGWYDYRLGRRYYGEYGIGPGFQMLFPVGQNGFIPTINNAFYVGFFTDFIFVPNESNDFGNGFFSFALGPMVQWRFFIFDLFSAFANVGFGIWPWFLGDQYGPYGTVLRFFPLFQVGGNLHFTQRVALTFAFGYPQTNVGFTFGF